jgi:hypothetical protein
MQNFYRAKRKNKKLYSFCKCQKNIQRKQSPNRRNFSQSGHPDCFLTSKKMTKNKSIPYTYACQIHVCMYIKNLCEKATVRDGFAKKHASLYLWTHFVRKLSKLSRGRTGSEFRCLKKLATSKSILLLPTQNLKQRPSLGHGYIPLGNDVIPSPYVGYWIHISDAFDLCRTLHL